MVTNKRIIVWTDRPPFFTKTPFITLANKGYKVTFLYRRDDIQTDRKSVHGSKDYGDAEIFNCKDIISSKENIINFFKQNPNSINIVNGFYISRFINYKEIKELFPFIKIYILSEKPITFKKPRFIFNIFSRLSSIYKAKNNKKYVDGIFAFGENACKYFINHGWDKEKVHNFIYTFDFDLKDYEVTGKNNIQLKKRFLYVGRFDYKIKGVNYYLKAINITKGRLFDAEFDFIGGYGINAKEILKLIKEDDRCNYLGVVKFEKILKILPEYDCVVVPSILDGWNINVLMALCRGVPVITTDGAGSHGLVKRFNFGLVVKKKKSKSLAKAMSIIASDEETYRNYRGNAIKFSNYFTNKKLGDYTEGILNNKKAKLY